MKKLAWLLVPIAVGFSGYLAADAEWQSMHEPPRRSGPLIGLFEPRQNDPSAAILFTGDVMLDRGVALHAAYSGNDALVAGVRPLFEGVDAVVINLEGTITNNPSVSIPNHSDLRFTFNPADAEWLRTIGVTAASLSNNHADDFGESGYESTKRYLDAAGIAHFGAPDNARDATTSISVAGKRVCLAGYEGFIATDPGPVAAQISAMQSGCDYIFATMHAGTEYAATSTALQEEAAHAFIDAGADAVIGTHPHVIEPLEMYRGKPIFYSLGNFIFDQDFSWASEHALAVKVLLSATSTTYVIVPVTITGEEASTTPPGPDFTRAIGALVAGQLSPDVAADIRNTDSFSIPK